MARSKFEIRAHKELEEDDWQVDYKIRPSGFKNPSNYNVDYFNIFDLLAYKPGEKLRWISIKPASNCPTAHQDDIRNFQVDENTNQKEIWRYDKDPKDKRRFRRRKWLFEDEERISIG